MESALEIRYSSLRLDKLPIEFSTVKEMGNSTLIKTFGATDYKIGNLSVKNSQARTVELKGRNYFEIKNREFKLGIEVKIKEDGGFIPLVNNFFYKIYESKNINRLIYNIKFLKEIFKGTELEMSGKNLSGKMYFENRIEFMKFELLENTLLQIQNEKRENLLFKGNSFYTLALLNLLETESEIDTWINLRYSNLDKEIEVGDRVKIERIHDIKGYRFKISEIITVLDPIEENEIKDRKINSYRKKCKIILKRIDTK